MKYLIWLTHKSAHVGYAKYRVCSYFGDFFIVLVGIAALLTLFGRFVYFFQTVEEQEVDVRFSSGQIKEMVEPNEALAAAAIAQTRSSLARERALAIYTENFDYLQLLMVQANANALNKIDKIIFTLEGMTPTLVLPGSGIVPTVETTADTTSSSTTEIVETEESTP